MDIRKDKEARGTQEEEELSAKIQERSCINNKPVGKSIFRRLFQRVGRNIANEVVEDIELVYYVEKYKTVGSSKRKKSLLQQLLLTGVEMFNIKM